MLNKVTCLIDGEYVSIVSINPDGAMLIVTYADSTGHLKTKNFMYDYSTGDLTISSDAIAE